MKHTSIVLAVVLFCIAGCAYRGTYGPPSGEEREARAISVKKPPRLVLIRGVGVYYAPDAKDDIFFYGGTWYYYSGIDWYMSQSYKGPWEKTLQGSLPQVMFRVPPEKFKTVPFDWGEVYRAG